MNHFFSPQRIAIAGASNADRKLGYAVMQRLLEGGNRTVIPIHPRERHILGVPTHASLALVDSPIDLLIALVPSAQLLPLIEQCAPNQVKYLLAISSGFAEVSANGRELQRRIVEAARKRAIRIVGPNSMGMLNAANHLNASLVPTMPPGGAGLSCVTQSGGFGIAVSMYALDHQLHIAKICDLGNTCDVQIPEVLDYLEGDPETNLVCLFLESLGNTQAFIEKVERLARAKPVIMTTLGRSEAGRRASLAHLGPPQSASEDNQLRDSELLVHVKTGRELLHIAKAMSWQPVPRGASAAILTATGGIGAELADLCIDSGIKVPMLPDNVQRRLQALLPTYAAIGNPIDVTPVYWQFAQIYPAVMRVLLDTKEIDMLIISITDVATELDELARAIVENRQCASTSPKPCFIFWGSRDDSLANMRLLERARLPCYRSTYETVRAAAASAQHNRRS